MAEPRRMNERRLKLLPRLTKSSTERELPRRLMPYADRFDPTRKKLRRLKLLPR
jgi:hypothetical protein